MGDLAHGGVALVLSSGSARGAAHVGVLLALEEAGVPVDLVVGTSAGALVGGVWAAGVPAERISERVLGATWADVGSALRVSPRLGLVETTALRTHLDALSRRRRVEDLPRRFAAVATDVQTREAVLLDHGRLTDVVCASMAVPGVFPPVRIDGRLYVDGVLTSALPVWAARRLGARSVVAVRLRPVPTGEGQARRLVPFVRTVPDEPADLEIVIDTTPYASWSPRDVAALVDLGLRAGRDALAEHAVA